MVGAIRSPPASRYARCHLPFSKGEGKRDDGFYNEVKHDQYVVFDAPIIVRDYQTISSRFNSKDVLQCKV